MDGADLVALVKTGEQLCVFSSLTLTQRCMTSADQWASLASR